MKSILKAVLLRLPLRLILSIVFLIPAFAVQVLPPYLRPHLGRPAAAMLVALLAAAIGLLAYGVYVKLIERRPVIELGAQRALRELGIGLVLGAALFSVVIGVLAALGLYKVQGWRDASVLVIPLAISISSGVVEELLFRGAIFRIIESVLGTWFALAVSAALFGIVHLGNPNATWLAAVAISLEAGVMLAGAYLLTRRLWMPIGIHAAWNFTQGGIFSVAVSGGKSEGLLVATLDGPQWLTGGEFGAEASFVAIVVCTAFGVWLLVQAARRGQFMAPLWRRPAAQASGPATEPSAAAAP